MDPVSREADPWPTGRLDVGNSRHNSVHGSLNHILAVPRPLRLIYPPGSTSGLYTVVCTQARGLYSLSLSLRPLRLRLGLRRIHPLRGRRRVCGGRVGAATLLLWRCWRRGGGRTGRGVRVLARRCAARPRLLRALLQLRAQHPPHPDRGRRNTGVRAASEKRAAGSGQRGDTQGQGRREERRTLRALAVDP